MLLPMITGTFYYATPENQWADLVHPFLSDWMVVYDPAAVKAFYEGTKGSAIPYDVWAQATRALVCILRGVSTQPLSRP